MSKEKPTHHHFYCLPFLNMGCVEEIDLRFAKIWNFSLKKDEYIKDKSLREHVEKILKKYKGAYPYGTGNGLNAYLPRCGIGFISVGTSGTQELNYEEARDANYARLLLFISVLERNNIIPRDANTGHSMASSENYAQVHFSAVVGSEYMTDHVGFVVPTRHMGIKIEEDVSIQPRHIPTPQFREDNADSNLLKSLLDLREKEEIVFQKIMSSIEVFYESYYNSPEVSHNARILLQASAFETLLDKEEDGGRKALKLFLKKCGDYPDDECFPYISERKEGKKEEKGTKRVIWADQFFTLRNHIIHGLVPKEKEYYFEKQRHFDIALYFFVFCLKRIIEKNLKKEIFGDDVVWETLTDDKGVKYTGFRYDAVGRRGWERSERRNKSHEKLCNCDNI